MKKTHALLIAVIATAAGLAWMTSSSTSLQNQSSNKDAHSTKPPTGQLHSIAPLPSVRLTTHRASARPILSNQTNSSGLSETEQDEPALDPISASDITQQEFHLMMRLVSQGQKRQHGIDKLEQQGEITSEKHAALSQALERKMSNQMRGVIGDTRAGIFLDNARQWARNTVPEIIQDPEKLQAYTKSITSLPVGPDTPPLTK